MSFIFSSYLPIFEGFKVAYYSFFFFAITASVRDARTNQSTQDLRTRIQNSRKRDKENPEM